WVGRGVGWGPGPGEVAPVREGPAREEPQPARPVVADVEADLRDAREGLPLLHPDVAVQGEHPARQVRRHAAANRGDRPANFHSLPGHPESNLTRHVDRPGTVGVLEDGPDLAAVELVLGLELVRDRALDARQVTGPG